MLYKMTYISEVFPNYVWSFLEWEDAIIAALWPKESEHCIEETRDETNQWVKWNTQKQDFQC